MIRLAGSINLVLWLWAVVQITAACTDTGPGREKGQTELNNSREQMKIILNNPLTYQLPAPTFEGRMTVEESILKRRSHRNFRKSSVTADQLSQILWAAYGITKPDTSRIAFRGGLRAAPSAGATYPLEVYVVAGNVDQVEPGVYRYVSNRHLLEQVFAGDIRKDLAEAALNQEMISDAPFSLIYSAIFERTTQRYGDRGRLRYVPMDLGHSAQNVYLQAESLGLGTCAVGAFNDEEVTGVMQLPDEEEVLYIMPVGKYFRD